MNKKQLQSNICVSKSRWSYHLFWIDEVWDHD